MEKIAKGDVVIIPFPFSDLSSTTLRPALTIATPVGNDIILCQITSKQRRDSDAIQLMAEEFSHGSLPVVSNIRPTKIFTADRSLVKYQIGKISAPKMKSVEEKIIAILRR